MLFFLSALAAPPPCTASQAPADYVGKTCVVGGDRPVCELGTNGSMVCDLRLEQDNCAAGFGDTGFVAWSVDWDGQSVSTFGHCLDVNAPPNPLFPDDYILFCCNEDDLASMSDVQLLGSDRRDTLSFRYPVSSTPTHYLKNEVRAGSSGTMTATMRGRPENDKLEGSDEARPYYSETLWGDYGVDSMRGWMGSDRMHGGPDHDIMDGGEGVDYLWGDLDPDVLRGGPDNDFLWGGDGGDTLYGQGANDALWGGPGEDFIYGGPGVDGLYGQDGPDHLWGDEQPDWIDGGPGDDFLYGGDHLDHMHGGEGIDHLEGGEGPDRMHGGRGDDTLLGGGGADWMFGGANNDRLEGGGGNDWLCEDQNIVIPWSGGVGTTQANTAAVNFISGGDGTDVVSLSTITPIPGSTGATDSAGWWPGDRTVEQGWGNPAHVSWGEILIGGGIAFGENPGIIQCTYLISVWGP